MGAGEVSQRLPAYLDGLGQSDVLLFSDRKDAYGQHQIHDALEKLRPDVREGNADFDVYDAIQRSTGADGKTTGGWVLDKYKFLPMVEHARHMRPESPWFVFIELDTYVDWGNLHSFLARFEPETPYYFGSPVWPSKKPVFAHGGTGFVLSGAAMDRLATRGKKYTRDRTTPGTHLFGRDLRSECCGDQVLASVLLEAGVTLKGYWPMFNGETPATVRFGPEQWCEAVLTLHHMSTDDFDNLKEWESASLRKPSSPLTFEELFDYVEPSLQDRIEDWTNLSEDIIHTGNLAGKSFNACYAACSSDRSCLQYEHSGDVCHMSHSVRLGRRQPTEDGKKWTSGWMMDRIRDFKSRHSPCGGARMVYPNP